MLLGKNELLSLVAIILLLIGIGSTLYVHATQREVGDTITIENKVFTYEQLFNICQKRELEEIGYSGVALDDIILKVGIYSPEKYKYTITGVDGYQKTVTWENMINGVLTEEKTVVFSNLPKAFRVRDVIEIEVI